MTTAANAEDWHVVQSSGEIWIGTGGPQPAALGTVTDVPGGATLTTGPSGRIMLARGQQTMLVSPNSVATIPQGDDQKFVTVLQRTGRIEFDVDRQQTPHFAVETPFLAAVVKGTHFTVSVGAAGADVTVDRGLVQVTDLATGDMVDTPAGQRASVGGPGAKLTVAGSGQLAAIVPGTPQAPQVERLSDQELRALQTQGAGAVSPAGIGGGHDDQAAGSGLAVIAGSSNGTGGGSSGSGGGPAGGSPASGGGDAPDSSSASGMPAQGPVALEIDDSQSLHLPRRSGDQSTTMIIAGALALSVMLAFGFAFLRGRAT